MPQIKPYIKFYNFTVLDDQTLLIILRGRNSEYVRTRMECNDIISAETHLQFCHNLSKSQTAKYFYITVDEKPYGVIDFNDPTAKWEIPEGGSYTFGDQPLHMRTVGDILNAYMRVVYGIKGCSFKIKNDNLRALLPFIMKKEKVIYTRLISIDDNYHYFITDLPFSIAEYKDKLKRYLEIYDIEFFDCNS